MAISYMTGGGTYRLQSSIGTTDTTIKLSSFLEPVSGTPYTMAIINSPICYGTLDPQTPDRSEFISFTGITQNADGTATLTGVTRGLSRSYPFTTDVTFKQTHSGQSIFVMSNSPQIYNDIYSYIDAAVVAGGVPATTSVLGLSKMSVAPASPSNPISVGTNDPRVPTADPTTLFALKAFYPVNSIYMEISGTNPATTLGFGTWTAWGAGRVPIGVGTGTVVATFASRASNVITVTGLTNKANNEFQTGQAVLYSAPSGAMTGLTHNTTYYVVKVSALTFSLASSLANAQNGTVISLSSDGTGTQTFTLTLTARAIGETGGEENHAMSTGELLSHSHSISNAWQAGSSTGAAGGTSNRNPSDIIATGADGGNTAMNNMQPFITCYFWLRTA